LLFVIVHDQYNLREFIRWIQQLNLFKMTDNRQEEIIKQQKITTRVYLFLVTSMFPFNHNKENKNIMLL